jgi:hypothetical protein
MVNFVILINKDFAKLFFFFFNIKMERIIVGLNTIIIFIFHIYHIYQSIIQIFIVRTVRTIYRSHIPLIHIIHRLYILL